MTDENIESGEGKNRRFTELYDKHCDDLLRFAAWTAGDIHKAEDILQEAFSKAWLRFHQLRDENRFFVWMCSICIGVHIRSKRTDARRRKKHLGFYEEYRGGFTEASDSDNPQQRRIKEETLKKIEALFRSLPDQSREVLDLQLIRNLSLTEIAESLGISKSTVKQRLAKARQLLALKFRALGDDFFEID